MGKQTTFFLRLKKAVTSGFLRKTHKWLGIVIGFFLILSAVSGLFMNHRKAIASWDVPRNWLPEGYHYNNWNNASAKGSIRLSEDSVLIYGGAGIWLSDSLHTAFTGFNRGLKDGADNQAISRIVMTASHQCFAASTFSLYRLDNGTWTDLSDRLDNKERLADLAVSGDSLIVMTRSSLYISLPPYRQFEKQDVPEPEGYVRKATLFRTLWLLHSGELFGLPGQLFVDALAILILILCVTGILFFFCPGIIRRQKRKGIPAKGAIRLMKWSLKWHNKLGALLLVLFLILFFTGMFLRPPLLIAIIRSEVGVIPGTVLADPNPWHDKLRVLRYDPAFGEWLLYTSDGFFSMQSLSSVPKRVFPSPPVSVMGVTVLEPIRSDEWSTGWVVGSFSGLYYWDREENLVVDCFTGRLAEGRKPGRPVADHPIGGYAADFSQKEVVFDYNAGAVVFDSHKPFAPMPEEIRNGRMSLWHLCLEVHTGRIYSPVIGPFADVFIFFLGLSGIYILLSGYFVYRKRHRKTHRSNFLGQ